MPICSECSQEKDRSGFSKVQLRKPATARRCKSCVDAVQIVKDDEQKKKKKGHEGEKLTGNDVKSTSISNDKTLRSKLRARVKNTGRAVPPADAPPLQDPDNKVLSLVKHTAIKIMQRGIPPNCGLDGLSIHELEARLWEVANNAYMTWLTIPFFHGLIKGGQLINKKLALLSTHGEIGEPHPILHWLCQYKLLQQFAYAGGDDMVALALRAGADANMTVSYNNALFFAVKYASARCVEMLLDAWVNVKQKDIYGHTIWKNALEKPNIEIIEVLIKRCNDFIPVSEERFKCFISQMHVGDMQHAIEYHMPDDMLSLYTGMVSTNNSVNNFELIRSWVILGDPTIDDLATALIRVMQAGARFSPNHALSTENLDPLSLVTHIDSPLVLRERYDQFQYDTICFLRNVIYGVQLPNIIQQEITDANQNFCQEKDITCPICLADMDSNETSVTLYCGHQFCVECIDAYAKNDLNENMWLRGGKEGDKRCPICRRLLCGVLLSGSIGVILRRSKLRFGIDRHEASWKVSDRRGPHVLTDEQLRFECDAIGSKSVGTRQELLKGLQDYTESVETKMESVEFRFNDGTTCTLDMNSDMKLELSASTNIIGGGDPPIQIFSPEKGPVVIPIEVKGVPILAWLSPNSFATVVPIGFVNSFGLKTKPLSSSQFIAYDGRKVSVVAVVDELKFKLDNIEICLNNTVVVKRESDMVIGIRLGMDFFESAAWTRCSTRFGGGSFIISDAGYTNNLFLPNQRDELRYYSRDGKICQIPFIHVQNYADCEYIPIVTLSGDLDKVSFDECQWCCRCFPSDGMLKGKYERGNGVVYYCDEECKSQGESLRGRLSPRLHEDIR